MRKVLLTSVVLAFGCESTSTLESGRPDRLLTSQTFECESVSDEPPVLISGRSPVYPVKRHIKGEVGYAILNFTINTTGAVENIQKVEASHPAFYASSKKAIKSWKFSPAKTNGSPVSVECTREYGFGLGKRKHQREEN